METKLCLLSYSDENYRAQQERLVERAKSFTGLFDEIFSETREILIETKFYKENKAILDEKRGAGFWLWKPFIILDALNNMKENDVLIYMDCGDWIMNGETMREFVLNRMKNEDILLTDGAYKQSSYTKRDCFYYMNCDSPLYHDAVQIEAGIIVCRNTPYARQIISEWLVCCMDENILTDIPNKCGIDNLPDFVDHRHDQSALSLLKYKLRIASSNEMRHYIHCNFKHEE